MRPVLIAMGLIAIPLIAFAADGDDKGIAAAGLLSGENKHHLEQVRPSAGVTLASVAWTLKSGRDYKLGTQGNRSHELPLDRPEFVRAIWLDEIRVGGLKIPPVAVDSIAFDKAGLMKIGFAAIKPGQDHLKIPGSTGDSQRLDIVIE